MKLRIIGSTTALVSAVLAGTWGCSRAQRLEPLKGGGYTWGGARAANPAVARVFFDNGSRTPVTVRIEDQGEFKVPGSKRVRLLAPPGPLRIVVRRASE